jgi:Zn-dependent protease
MIIELLFTEPILFFIVVIALIFALSIHEFFHAWMADFLGDQTPKLQGRLTLNPLAHLDPFGTLLLLIFGFGWGKPVPINPYNLKNPKKGEILISLAGPLSNLSIALAVSLFLRAFPFFPKENSLLFLTYFIWINIILGVFNLLPVFPLDGSRVFLNILPSSLENLKTTFLQISPFLIFFAIIFMSYVGIPYFCQPLFQLITGMSLSF